MKSDVNTEMNKMKLFLAEHTWHEAIIDLDKAFKISIAGMSAEIDMPLLYY